MLTKDELLESILHECDVAVHLASKIPAGGLDHRPTPGQRSNLELLRYIAFCGIGGARAMIDGDWHGYKEWEEKTAQMTAEEFPAAMERQKDALRELISGLTDADLKREATHPMGHKLTIERALLEITLKWLTGYRMQLFLGAKAAGNDEIWTPDCWAGVSMPRDRQPA